LGLSKIQYKYLPIEGLTSGVPKEIL